MAEDFSENNEPRSTISLSAVGSQILRSSGTMQQQMTLQPTMSVQSVTFAASSPTTSVVQQATVQTKEISKETTTKDIASENETSVPKEVAPAEETPVQSETFVTPTSADTSLAPQATEEAGKIDAEPVVEDTVIAEETVQAEETPVHTEQTVANKNMAKSWADALTRMTDFEGRTTRYDFWAFQSFSLVIFLLLALIGYFLAEPKMVIDIFAVYFLLPAASSCTRRLHDISMSGWWMAPAVVLALATLICWNFGVHNIVLLLFATLVYVSYLLNILRQKGDVADNKYGKVINEAGFYHIESRAFINFMVTFMFGLWLIFAAYLFKF